MDIGIVVTAINNATASLKGVANDIGLIGDKSQETANRLKAIQVVIAGIALEKGLEFGKKFLEAAASVQNMELRVQGWAGSMKDGRAVLDDFRESLSASGVKMESLSGAFVKLRASGVNTSQAVETVKDLVNGIAAVGGGDLDGKLTAAATSFQRFASKGVVSTRELNAIITNTGITVGELADQMGISVGQFYEQLRNKTTGAQTLLDAFNRAAEQKFGHFSELLGSTVGGSLTKFKVDLEEAIGALGSRTTLNAGIAVMVNEIDKAVVNWIGHIKQGDIDHFFAIIKALGPLALEVAHAIGLVAEVVGFVGSATLNLLNHMPSEAVEFGMIGYFLLGKRGAVLGALIGTIADQLPKLESTTGNVTSSFQAVQQKGGYQALLDYNNAQSPNSPLANMFQSAGEYAGGAFFEGLKDLGDMFDEKVAKPLAKVAKDAGTLAGTNQATGFLDGFDKKVKTIQDALAKLGNTKFGVPEIPGAPGNGHDITAQLAAIRATTDATIGGVTEKRSAPPGEERWRSACHRDLSNLQGDERVERQARRSAVEDRPLEALARRDPEIRLADHRARRSDRS
jgi:tape measure domain-containing protein